MRFHHRILLPACAFGLVVFLNACTADLSGTWSPEEHSEERSGNSGDRAGCEVTEVEAVPKLLRMSHFEYRSIVSDLLGEEVPEELLSHWTPLSEVHGFDTMSESRIDARGLDEQLRTVEELAEWSLESRWFEESCPDPSLQDPQWEDCGRSFVTALGSRAFRRPLTQEEITGYQELFAHLHGAAQNASLLAPGKEALLGVVQAVLLSPHLTFKPELLPSGFDEANRSFARASKLSLFLLSSVPDDELWAAAEAGELDSSDELEHHARRIFEQNPSRFLLSFAGQWLGFRDLPLEADDLLLAMRSETRAVFSDLFDNDRTAPELLAPGFTIVSPALAEHYGLEATGATPDDSTRIATTERGGVLSQGYFLKRTASGSDFRRAVHRGLWVITRLLCQEIPRIDAATLEEISASFDGIDRTRPLAEQMEIHRNSATRCAGCHDQIDPIGLALENYDSEGLWRDMDDNGHPIESDLELLGQVVDNPSTLATVIGNSEEYKACVATKLLTYALNRGPDDAEKCVASEFMGHADDSPATLKDAAIQALLRSFEMTEVVHD